MHKALPLQNITITDQWFGHYRDLVRDVVIPYQWRALHDEVEGAEPSYSVRNLRLAAAKRRGEPVTEHFKGFVFQDSDLVKYLEAVAFVLATEPDPALKAKADELIDLLAAAQEEDGYLNSYFSLENPDQRWKNLADCHELYVAGHLIEAATAYFEATGERKLLDVAIRFADLIGRTFGPARDQIHGYPGHEEVELALVKLWQVTGADKYLELARYFIDQRGQSPNYFLEERKSPDFFAYYPGSDRVLPHLPYHQADVPVLEQDHAEGHAVRALYLYCAMADVAAATGDEALLRQTIKLWEDITQHQMYVTGGVGQSGTLERFTVPDDLPNDANYAETCANIALALFSLRLGRITGEARYHDIAELELYNAIASGISRDGTSFFYVNPMEIWPDNCLEASSRGHVKPTRQAWFSCACCPPNLARTYASLGQYLLSVDDDEVFIQQYVGFTTELELGGSTVTLSLSGDYTIEGKVTLTAKASQPVKLALRRPGWCHDWNQGAPASDGYLHLTLPAGSNSLDLDFRPEAQFLAARPEVRADRGLAALRRGPLIFAAESVDNGPNLAALRVAVAAPPPTLAVDTESRLPCLIAEGVREELPDWPADQLYRSLAEQSIIETACRIKYVPYAFWGNRGTGEMRVWLRY